MVPLLLQAKIIRTSNFLRIFMRNLAKLLSNKVNINQRINGNANNNVSWLRSPWISTSMNFLNQRSKLQSDIDRRLLHSINFSAHGLEGCDARLIDWFLNVKMLSKMSFNESHCSWPCSWSWKHFVAWFSFWLMILIWKLYRVKLLTHSLF